MRKTKMNHRILSMVLALAVLVTLFGGVPVLASAESDDVQQDNHPTVMGKTVSYPASFGAEQGANGFSYYTGFSVDTLEPAVYQNGIWVDAAPVGGGEAFQMAGNGAIVPGNGKVAALGYTVAEDGILSADVIYKNVGNSDIDISRWENAYANGIVLSVVHKKADGNVVLYSKEVKTFLFARNALAFRVPETVVNQGDELLFVFDSNALSEVTGSTGTASNWKDGGYLDLTIYTTEEGHTLPTGRYNLSNAAFHSWPGAWTGNATKVSEVPAQFAHGTGGFSHYITAPRWNGTEWNTSFDPIRDNYIYLNNSYTALSNGVPAANGLTNHIPRYFTLGANGYFCPGQYGENVVVSYTAEKSGLLLLDWKITNQPGANQTEVWHMLGYQVHIYKNSERIYSKSISNTANTDVHQIKLNVDVNAGDVLYFAIDPDNGEMAGAADGTYNWTGYGIDWSDNGTMDISILEVGYNAYRSNDSSLSAIKVDNKAVSNFVPDILQYSVIAAGGADKVSINVETNHAGATVKINGQKVEAGADFELTNLNLGANNVEIEVVAEDGLAMTVYQLEVVRKGGSSSEKSKTYSYPALFGSEQGANGFSYYTGFSVDTLEPAVYQNGIWVDAAPVGGGEAFQMAGNGAIVPGNGKVAALGYTVAEDGILSADVIYKNVGNGDIDISRWENAYANGIILSVVHKKADGNVVLCSKEVKTLLFARNAVAFHLPEMNVKQGEELLFVFDSNALGEVTGSTGTASNWKDGGYLDLTIYTTEEGYVLPSGAYNLSNATYHSWPGTWTGNATKASEVPAQFEHGTGGFSHYITSPRWNGTEWNTSFDPIRDNHIYLNNSYTALSNGVPAANGLTNHIPRYFTLGANGYFCPGQYGENAVVSYKAEKDGTLMLDWKITNQPGANQVEVWHMLGYQVHIYKNSERIYSKSISNTATVDVHQIKLNVDVNAGDVLYFAIDPDNGEMAGAASGLYNWTGYGIDWSDNGTMDISILAVGTNVKRSDNSKLSAIKVDGDLLPGFSPSVNAYTFTVSETTDKITLQPVASHAGASVFVNGKRVAAGSSYEWTGLDAGVNSIVITVIAENGYTTTEYKLDVVREGSGSAELSALSVTMDEAELITGFASDVFTYAVSVPHGTEAITLKATTASARATMTLNGEAINSAEGVQVALTEEQTTATITVTAQDGITTKTYEVTVTVLPPLSDDAVLHDLTIADVELLPEFAAEVTEYTATVKNEVAEVTIKTSCNEKATMYVNDALVTSEEVKVALTVGENTVTIKVVAEDGTEKTYTLTITREEPVMEEGKLRIEAETGVLNNCVAYSDFKNASGGLCVGKFDYYNSTVTLSFEVPEAGMYRVTIGYTAGFGDASGLISVNGGSEREVLYPSTGEWNNFAETFTNVWLSQGANTLRLRKANGYCAPDYLVIEKTSAGVPQYYEAENAVLNNCVVYKDFNFASNGLCAGQIDYQDSYVEFKVNVGVEGNYRMGIRYSTGFDTNPVMLVGVNGGAGVPVTLPLMGKWDDWFTIYKTVTLEKGTNVIRLQKGEGFAAIDYISLAWTSAAADAEEEPALHMPTLGTPFTDSASPFKEAPKAEQIPSATQPQQIPQDQTPTEVEADNTWFTILMLVICGICVIGTAALYVVAFAQDKKWRQGA